MLGRHPAPQSPLQGPQVDLDLYGHEPRIILSEPIRRCAPYKWIQHLAALAVKS